MNKIKEGAMNTIRDERFGMMEQNARIQQIEIEARVCQAKLEGIFRSMYQACTQAMLMPHIKFYEQMMDSAVQTFNIVKALHKEHIDLRNEESPEDGPSVN